MKKILKTVADVAVKQHTKQEEVHHGMAFIRLKSQKL